MAYQCGPYEFDIRPPDASFVRVTTWDGKEVVLASPIVVDSQGRISFQVYDPGRYHIYVTEAYRVYTKSYTIDAILIALDPESETAVTQAQLYDVVNEIQTVGPSSFDGHKIFIRSADPDTEATDGDVWIPIP